MILLAALPLLLAADFKVDTTRSTLSVAVYKKGAASGFLHDHAMVPSDWSGTVSVDPAKPETLSVDLLFQAATLHDTEAKLSAGDKAKVDTETRTNVLEADKFATIEFKATSFTADAPGSLKGKLSGSLTLHGQTHALEVPVEASVVNGELHAKGKVPLLQTAFGIKPISKLLGTIQVMDSVDVIFDLVAAPVAAAAVTPAP